VDIVAEDQNLAGQAEHEFGIMMLTAPPRETVMLLCGSLGSTNRSVDPYRWLALVIDPDAGKSDHQEGQTVTAAKRPHPRGHDNRTLALPQQAFSGANCQKRHPNGKSTTTSFPRLVKSTSTIQ